MRTPVLQRLANFLVLVSGLLTPCFSQSKGNPFVGRWDFNITSPSGTRATWLGVMEKGGNLEVWCQPTGGYVEALVTRIELGFKMESESHHRLDSHAAAVSPSKSLILLGEFGTPDHRLVIFAPLLTGNKVASVEEKKALRENLTAGPSLRNFPHPLNCVEPTLVTATLACVTASGFPQFRRQRFHQIQQQLDALSGSLVLSAR